MHIQRRSALLRLKRFFQSEKDGITPSALPIQSEYYGIDEQTVELQASKEADLILQNVNILPPWQREWAASAPGELLAWQKAGFQSASLGIRTPELEQFNEKFAVMCVEFLDKNDLWKNIVEEERPTHGGTKPEKALYIEFKQPGGGAILIGLPAGVTSQAHDVLARRSQSSVSIAPAPTFRPAFGS